MDKLERERIKAIASGLRYFGESERTRARICQTIARLPDKVALFARENCCYTSLGDVWGLTLPGRVGMNPFTESHDNHWIILVTDEDEASGDDVLSMIAHEIAHAWRGDDRAGDIPEDCEIQAAKLVAAWGFSGRGADPEFCDR